MIYLAADPVKFAIFVGATIAFCIIAYFISKMATEFYEREGDKSRELLTDREFLLAIQNEPDGIINWETLREKYGLTKWNAKHRLTYLHYKGLLKQHYNASYTKYFYSLKNPIPNNEILTLSGKPFLTVEDIISIFKHHDYQLTIQKICISTGLPVSIITRELKFFIKEKVVQKIVTMDAQGTSSHFYTLKEPYRSRPEVFEERGDILNLELEKIFRSSGRA